MAAMNQSPKTNIAALPYQAEHVVVGIAMGYAGSQILFNAEELGIFELLKDGPQELASLAQATGIQPHPLERLLIGCCALGLLVRNGETFTLTDVSRNCLLKDAPTYVGGLFSFFKRGLYPVWEHLDKALLEDGAQWKRVPSIGSSGLFDALYRDERSLREFHQATYQMSYMSSMIAMRHFDFSHFRTIVDIGGGTGGFLAGICSFLPGVQGIIFDLPIIKDLTGDVLARTGLNDRVRFISGNFFQDPLPAGDLYVLGDILHDWTTTEGTEILNKIYGILPKGGALMIAEKFLNDRKDGSYLSAVMNLTTLLTTKGQHHSPSEFENWLTRVGFSKFEHCCLSESPRDFLLAWKQ